MKSLIINEAGQFVLEGQILDSKIKVVPVEYSIVDHFGHPINVAMVWLPDYQQYTFMPLNDGYDLNSTCWLLKFQYKACFVETAFLEMRDPETEIVVQEMRIALFCGRADTIDRVEVPTFDELREEFIKVCEGQ